MMLIVLLNTSEDQESYHFRVCKAECSEKRPCIPKCCPPGEFIDIGYISKGQRCVEMEGFNWSPVYYNDTETKTNRTVENTHYSLKRIRDWSEILRNPENQDCRTTVAYTRRGDFKVE
jgi:hypothetical protein